jgi:hypothetical protein
LLQDNERREKSPENEKQSTDKECGAVFPTAFALRALGLNLHVEQLQELLWRWLGGFGLVRRLSHVRH